MKYKVGDKVVIVANTRGDIKGHEFPNNTTVIINKLNPPNEYWAKDKNDTWVVTEQDIEPIKKLTKPTKMIQKKYAAKKSEHTATIKTTTKKVRPSRAKAKAVRTEPTVVPIGWQYGDKWQSTVYPVHKGSIETNTLSLANHVEVIWEDGKTTTTPISRINEWIQAGHWIIQPEDTVVQLGPSVEYKTACPTILKIAEDLIYGDREKDYGNTLDNFTDIATGWEVLFKVKITPEQVGLAMAWLKICRANKDNAEKTDSIIDCAGYMGCIEKIKKDKKSQVKGN